MININEAIEILNRASLPDVQQACRDKRVWYKVYGEGDTEKILISFKKKLTANK
ncbi:MAG: hypothetical protein UY48_C0017G0008 [Candidatus Gottesmanbacteria bacterium GW2011_GWB1_49_7]|uniref:Uncharacterized protein n=1 Tax=Candidatus Gottesmanbacteria bacterium GW2011_GWB1_49_7 TaxID=1618448 RepID=A0A0G1VYU2_9BACT|nr:MAG: hypothetical protein UY48_C0017G0008 [Candidatus Gottesmanbacteria bacterium GW2011_GWB1_49_7]